MCLMAFFSLSLCFLFTMTPATLDWGLPELNYNWKHPVSKLGPWVFGFGTSSNSVHTITRIVSKWGLGWYRPVWEPSGLPTVLMMGNISLGIWACYVCLVCGVHSWSCGMAIQLGWHERVMKKKGCDFSVLGCTHKGICWASWWDKVAICFLFVAFIKAYKHSIRSKAICALCIWLTAGTHNHHNDFSPPWSCSFPLTFRSSFSVWRYCYREYWHKTWSLLLGEIPSTRQMHMCICQ